jgi:prepilin-type processing-associated H-X9-DG protein
MSQQKQLGVAMYAWDATHGDLPRGTPKEAAQLPVDQRLSWMATLLPYFEQFGGGGEDLALDKPWNAPENDPTTKRPVPVFLNPRLGGQETNQTHYVGMAGVGKDAAKLPANDPKAGIFGYDRATKFQDIRDGASNTIAVIGIEKNPGPWGQGGPSTIRGLSEKPYIGGKDGFGGQSGGVNVLMADGSVRFISNSIDDKVLEAMATKSGGEPIPFSGEP